MADRTLTKYDEVLTPQAEHTYTAHATVTNRLIWMLARWGQDIPGVTWGRTPMAAAGAWRNRALTSSTGQHPVASRVNRSPPNATVLPCGVFWFPAYYP